MDARQDSMATSYPAPRTLVVQLGVGLAAALVCALLMGMLWAHQDLPDRPLLGAMGQAARPAGLRAFASLALPAVVFLPSLALALLVSLLPPQRRSWALPAVRRALRQDAASYLVLPAMLLLPVLWRELGNGFLALGLLFMGALSFKAAVLLRFLWGGLLKPWPGESGRLGARGQVAVFVAAMVVLGFAAVWVNQAVSTTAEEAGWLLEAEALQRGPDFAESSQEQRQAAREFYWSGGPEQAVPPPGQDTLFALFIAPVQAVGGRLGVLLLFAALMAAMACQLLAWLEEVGAPRGAAAAAAGLVLLSAPVWVAGQQVLPDVPAMLLFVLGLRLLTGLEGRSPSAALGLAVVAAALAGLKLRLAPLAGGLVAWGGVSLAARRWGWLKATLAGLGLVALAVAGAWWLPRGWWPRAVAFSWGEALAQLQEAPGLARAALQALAGLALDQNYGVLVTAPVYLLALAGVPAALARRPRAALQALVPAALYLAAVCLIRWHLWYGGQAGPGRLLAVALPALALPLAMALEGLRRPWWRLWALVLAALSLAYTWLITLAPAWRFSLPSGVNPLAASLEDALGLFLRQLLPSLLTPSPVLAPWLVGSTALVLLLALAVWRHTRREDAAPVPSPSPREALAVPFICAGLLLGALAWGSLAHISVLEAEGMRATGARAWAARPGPGAARGWVLRPGGRLSGRLYFPGGEAAVRLVGRPRQAGRVSLSLEGRLFEQPWPKDKASALVALGPVSQGTHRLSVAWSSCPEPDCSLVLDRLELAPPPPSPSSSSSPAGASPQSSR